MFLFMRLRSFALYNIHSSILEPYGICILQSLFSGCEYDNDAAKFRVVYLHYVCWSYDDDPCALWAEFSNVVK